MFINLWEGNVSYTLQTILKRGAFLCGLQYMGSSIRRVHACADGEPAVQDDLHCLVSKRQSK